MIFLLSIFFYFALAVSIFYSLFQLILIARFKKAHSNANIVPVSSPFSLLRPVHGADAVTYELLASACRQSVVPSEILFGVDDPNDTVIPLVRQLENEFPHIAMTLHINKDIAPNRKVGKLAALQAISRFSVLVIVDQDILLPARHFEKILSRFSDPQVGLVTALYSNYAPKTLGSALETLAIHGDFFPSVLVSESLEKGLHFAFGATLAIRREILEKIGGFEILKNILADDHELGVEVCKAGYQVVLSDSIVEHFPGSLSLSDYFDRAIRAARTHRVCRPWGVAFSLLTQGFPWALCILLVSSFSPFSLKFFLAWLLMRFLLVFAAHFLLTNRKGPWWPLALFPFHEAARFLFWILAFTGNTVHWRGRRYLVSADGRMQEA